MAIKMKNTEDEPQNETQTEGRTIEQGLPEREPETIGEALRKYYEEQLTHSANIKTETGRKAALLQILAVHSASLN